MRIFSRRTLVDFRTKHPDAGSSLSAWYTEVSKSSWNSPGDIATMEIKLIKTEADYDLALARFEVIFHAAEKTAEGEEAEFLSYLIEKYEDEHFPIDPPDPIEALKFRMEQQGLKKKDIAQIIGYKSRVSEIFAKKRKLSLDMIRKLHKELKIPYEALLKEY